MLMLTVKMSVHACEGPVRLCVCPCVGGGLLSHLVPGYLPLLKLDGGSDTERISGDAVEQPVLQTLQESREMLY